MAVGRKRTRRVMSVAIANGVDTSDYLDLTNAVAGGYFVPAAFTNVGATNLMTFDVSNNYGDPTATVVTALLPTTTIATAQSQRHTVSTYYPFLPDVFKFRYARFNGVANEGAARVLVCEFLERYTEWKRARLNIIDTEDTTDALDIRGAVAGSWQTPAELDGSAATYLVSHDGSTYTALATTADAAISQGIAVDRLIPFPDGVFNFNYVKIKSGSAESPARFIIVDLKY